MHVCLFAQSLTSWIKSGNLLHQLGQSISPKSASAFTSSGGVGGAEKRSKRQQGGSRGSSTAHNAALPAPHFKVRGGGETSDAEERAKMNGGGL